MPYLGELSALTTAVLWTGGMLSFAEATRRVGSVYVNVLRLCAAVVLLFFTIIIGDYYESVTSSQVGYLILSGLVGFVSNMSVLGLARSLCRLHQPSRHY
jgi:hypothetical protein